MSEQFEPEVRRDRREHGGAGGHPDDDALAHRTEQERVDAGVDAFDPDDVPPATDEAPAYDASEDEANQDALALLFREPLSLFSPPWLVGPLMDAEAPIIFDNAEETNPTRPTDAGPTSPTPLFGLVAALAGLGLRTTERKKTKSEVEGR